ncbi:hypothetical protein NGRA_0610 [Nosema granulosis]|uniref:Uncharacterized protein n=1 Tax=Nosema granulosis TaxID=83296 RepID=A0A9P6H378_9MICR|nr:hypothetical protein NGRA_0610 [Nosema granulosis]
MENTIRKIFKTNIDLNFDSRITLEQQQYVIERIRENEEFIVKEKTKVHLFKNFFMEFDENYVFEKLTTSKFINETFVFKNISLKVAKEESKTNSLCTNSINLEDFYSDRYKDRLIKETTNVKKESNWSLLSLRDILDVDHKKHTDKADSLFLSKNYAEACKIYSKYKLEDDFSHYNMEMEVYSRYLSNSNPYLSIYHLTNTNFVNSFYHHRLVLVLLLIDQNDLCFRISRLLNEPFKMFIDLELSNRFLKETLFFRKALEMLFFCISYYKSFDFPCDDLVDRFLERASPNIKLLETPIKHLKRYQSRDETQPIKNIKPRDLNSKSCTLKEYIEIRGAMLFVLHKDNLFCILNNETEVESGDKIYFLYSHGELTVNNNTNIVDSCGRITSLFAKHIVFEHEKAHNLLSDLDEIFYFKDIVKRFNCEHLKLKELSIGREGCITLENVAGGVSYCNSINIQKQVKNRFYIDSEHFVYQYQIYNVKIGDNDSCENLEFKFDKLGVFYKKTTLPWGLKSVTMVLKFIVMKYFDFEFSWNKILPSILSLQLHRPTNENITVRFFKPKNGEILKRVAEIEGRVLEYYDSTLDQKQDVCEVSLSNGSYIDRLKKEVLGIQESLFEEFYDEVLEINTPVETSLCFTEYLEKQCSVSTDKKGRISLHLFPSYQGCYYIHIDTPNMKFVVPFGVSFKDVQPETLIYILSSSFIRKNTTVKIFCLVNNYRDETIYIRINSKTIEIEDLELSCKPLVATIYEIKCKFLETKIYNKRDISLVVFNKNNEFYNYDLFVDLKVSEHDSD